MGSGLNGADLSEVSAKRVVGNPAIRLLLVCPQTNPSSPDFLRRFVAGFAAAYKTRLPPNGKRGP
jgi:hypothetical protein